MKWTEQQVRLARDIAKSSGTKAAAELLGTTQDAVRNALKRHELSIDVTADTERQHVTAAPAGEVQDELVDRLVALSKKGITFEELCNRLAVPPKAVRELIEEAQRRGFAVDGIGEEVLWAKVQPRSDVIDIAVPKQATAYRKFAVMSDLHFGSKYHLREQLVDFVEQAYEGGARLIFLPGDLLDGCYRHGRWELTHHGFREQLEDFCRGLPQRIGLRYLGISGNHDQTFEETGEVVHVAIENHFRANGREDLTMLGARGATVRLRGEGDPGRGLLVEMWHPLKGPAYAMSYKLQKKIEGYAPGQKPDVLLTGHWHQSVYLNTRGIHAFSCGTFQGGGSAFGRALGGSPSIGGWQVEYALTDDGTVRHLKPHWVSYFEHELPREVAL